MNTTLAYHHLITLITFFGFLSIVHSAVILDTDFDGIPAGSAGVATLNRGTTGGTWALNTGRDGAGLSTIQDSFGNHALLLDDNNGGNSGLISFATLSMTTPADVSTAGSSLLFNFTTATRRTGVNKVLRYSFQAADGLDGSSRWRLHRTMTEQKVNEGGSGQRGYW